MGNITFTFRPTWLTELILKSDQIVIAFTFRVGSLFVLVGFYNTKEYEIQIYYPFNV